MPSKQFQFDESGNYFYCFLVAAYTLAIIPLTYCFWPKSESKDLNELLKKKCHCLACQRKRIITRSTQSKKAFRRIFIRFWFIIGWLILLVLFYHLPFYEEGKSGFDPYTILGISLDASAPEIRKAYKQLSLINHPDKGGDEKTFIQISKAYSALTNEISRKNWQEYGNPDGPESMNYGIALPEWIIAKENKFLVIGFYVFLFLLVLPIGVGRWWYKTMRYSASNVLLVTKHAYIATFGNCSLIPLRQVISFLSKSYEFSNQYNKEIKVRPSDNIELPPLIKLIPEFTVFKKAIVGAPYEVKARSLIYAHLMRLNLNSDALEKGENKTKKSSAIDQLIQSMENCMELIPMIIQAILDTPPLTQLPHIDMTMVKALGSGGKTKTVVKNIFQLANLPDDKRRQALHSLSDEQYKDVTNVLTMMPHLKITASWKVADEENHNIWPMTVITCNVILERTQLCQVTNASITPSGVHDTDSYYATTTSGNNYSPRHVTKPTETNQSQSNDHVEGSDSVSNEEDIPQGNNLMDEISGHVVHCPFFLNEKYEGWWLYIVDRKNKRLVIKPHYISNLQSKVKLDLKFMAPQLTGPYLYTIYVRSDSYVDFTFNENIKFVVEPLPEEIRRQLYSNITKNGFNHLASDSDEASDDLILNDTDSSDESSEYSANEDSEQKPKKKTRNKKKNKIDSLFSNGSAMDDSSAYESEAEKILLMEQTKKVASETESNSIITSTEELSNKESNY